MANRDKGRRKWGGFLQGTLKKIISLNNISILIYNPVIILCVYVINKLCMAPFNSIGCIYRVNLTKQANLKIQRELCCDML